MTGEIDGSDIEMGVRGRALAFVAHLLTEN